jgi:hypothetical protein
MDARYPIDINALRRALAERAREVATGLLGEPNPARSNKGELRFGNRGSLAVLVAGEKAGCWFDFENGDGGNLLALIQKVERISFPHAIQRAQEMIGGARHQLTYRPSLGSSTAGGKPRKCTKALALSLWDDGKPIGGTIAARYLESRHVLDPALSAGDTVLRFHPNCPFKGATRVPCLIALMRDVRTNEPRAVVRTALTADGRKVDRMSLGPTTGGAIKLSADEDVTLRLAIGEGLETVLSGMRLGFSPAWALGGTSGLKNFPVLGGIECLTILVDNDKHMAGQKAAIKCSARWTAAGREVRRVTPRGTGDDLNDVIRKRSRREGKSND